jgi:hypothetical protein
VGQQEVQVRQLRSVTITLTDGVVYV